MDSHRELLLEVWREVSRHTDIDRSTVVIARLLAATSPIEWVIVSRIEPGRSAVEMVAGATAQGDTLPLRTSTCSAATIAELCEWPCGSEVVQWPVETTAEANVLSPPVAEALIPGGAGERPMALGPLGAPGRRSGVLILVLRAEASHEPELAQLARMLLDPFTVALDNDHRLREIQALREAAEADRRSLLTRLGRKQLADNMVGAETGLRTVMERVGLVAPNDVPVLIFGETGTGKELVARTIHTRSRRPHGPFHRVNCGAIPPELIDSELFGHERGAFTGAEQLRKGWFERADGGTLFLDEIGELPAAAQVRLLRILQDGWLERVGGHQPIHVDVRIVAATHRDLAAMVAEGRFREDLWYRLAVFPVVLPPLRERRDDIPELACHFAQRAATRFGLTPVLPTEDDLRLLSTYAWPGNVRELGAVIDRAAILGDGRRLEVATALGVAGEPTAADNRAARLPASAGLPRQFAGSSANQPGVTPFATLEDATRRHIELALQRTAGRVEGRYGAAALLGIKPATLRSKMRKLKIDRRRFSDSGTGRSESQ